MTEPRFLRDADSFAVLDADDEVIGRNLYRDVENSDGTKQRVFPKVVVHPDHRGVGLAAQLVKHSIDISLDEGFRIVPVCPYVAQWMQEHDGGSYLQYRDEPGTEHFNVG